MRATVEVVWEDPPPEPPRLARSTQSLLDALTTLKSRPDTWARIGVWPGQSGAWGARKRLVELNAVPGKFEYRIATKYGDDQKGSALYARYIAK